MIICTNKISNGIVHNMVDWDLSRLSVRQWVVKNWEVFLWVKSCSFFGVQSTSHSFLAESLAIKPIQGLIQFSKFWIATNKSYCSSSFDSAE